VWNSEQQHTHSILQVRKRSANEALLTCQKKKTGKALEDYTQKANRIKRTEMIGFQKRQCTVPGCVTSE